MVVTTNSYSTAIFTAKSILLTRIRKNDTSYAQRKKRTHANAHAMTQLLFRAVLFRFILRERYRRHVVAVHGR